MIRAKGNFSGVEQDEIETSGTKMQTRERDLAYFTAT